jgi:hypothetical protein
VGLETAPAEFETAVRIAIPVSRFQDAVSARNAAYTSIVPSLRIPPVTDDNRPLRLEQRPLCFPVLHIMR